MLGDRSTMGFPDVPSWDPMPKGYPCAPLDYPFPRGSIHYVGCTCLSLALFTMVSGMVVHQTLGALPPFLQIPGRSPPYSFPSYPETKCWGWGEPSPDLAYEGRSPTPLVPRGSLPVTGC
jgi:hypothetical protein